MPAAIATNERPGERSNTAWESGSRQKGRQASKKDTFPTFNSCAGVWLRIPNDEAEYAAGKKWKGKKAVIRRIGESK